MSDIDDEMQGLPWPADPGHGSPVDAARFAMMTPSDKPREDYYATMHLCALKSGMTDGAARRYVERLRLDDVWKAVLAEVAACEKSPALLDDTRLRLTEDEIVRKLAATAVIELLRRSKEGA